MFEDGGLEDEGGQVDPVSGNEVPIGGTKKGVRDDVPAMVSEGEFIFPEDVTRYIGLDKLMQLRQEAKMGLKRMEKMGQMGNGDEATMPDDMPFNMSDLMGAEAIVIEGRKKDDDEAAAIVAMAQGGVIYAQAGTSVPTTRSLAPVEQKPDYGPISFSDVAGDALQQTKVYVNKDGEKINVMFVGDNPLYPIPEGYTLFDPNAEATEIEDVVDAVTEKVLSTKRSGSRTPMKKTPFQEAGGWDMDFKTNGVVDPAKVKLWTDEYAKTSGNATAALTGVATVLGGPLGILVYLAGKGNAKSAAAYYDDAVKAAQQTNVAGQVAALKKINSSIKEGGDKTLLGKIVDKLKTTLGFTDDQAEKVKIVSSETPEQRKARLAAEKVAAAAAQGNNNVDADLTSEALPYDPKAIASIAAADKPGQMSTKPYDPRASNEADAKAAAAIAAANVNQQGDLEKTTIPTASQVNASTGLPLESKRDADGKVVEYTAAELQAFRDAKAAANSDTDAAPKADAAQIAVDGVQTSSLPPEMQLKISQREKADKQYMDVYRQPFNDFGNPGDAELLLELDNRMRYASTDAEKRKLDQMFEDVVIRQIDDQDNKLRVAKDLQIQTKNTIDPAAFASINISTQQEIEQAGEELGASSEDVNAAVVALKGQTAEDLEKTRIDPLSLFSPRKGIAGTAGSVDSNIDVVEEDSNIANTTKIELDKQSAKTTRGFIPKRDLEKEADDKKAEADKARAARKARRDAEKLKQELKEKAEFNARATKGSGNLALERAIARAREAVPTRTNEELINIAQQTVAGQAAGKGYVGGFGFKKGGLASRKKKKK